LRTVFTYCLVLFYFLISIRLTANVHYCGGKIRAVSVVGFSKQQSCCEGKPMKRNCCKNVKVCLKQNGEDQRVSSVAFLIAPVVIPPVTRFAELHPVAESYVPQTILPSVHAPPPEAFPPVYLKNCVFLI
jgi:hypothetical protein